MQTNASFAFLPPPLALYCFPRKLGTTIWADLPSQYASPPATALYSALSFQTRMAHSCTYMAHDTDTQKYQKSSLLTNLQLIETLLAESLIRLLLHGCTALQLHCYKCCPTQPCLGSASHASEYEAAVLHKKNMPALAGVRLRLPKQAQRCVRGLFAGGA